MAIASNWRPLRQDLRLEPEVAQQPADMLRRLPDRRLLGADGGQLAQLRQLGKRLVQVVVDVAEDVLHRPAFRGHY